MKKVKIENHEDLIRDEETKAVLNADLSSLQSYKKRRNLMRQKDAEIVEIKNELSEMKELLHQLIAEKSK